MSDTQTTPSDQPARPTPSDGQNKPEEKIAEVEAPKAPATEAAKPKRAPRRRSTTPRTTTPLYSLEQVAQIIDFTNLFDDSDDEFRNTYFAAFGWASDTDADGLRVAEATGANPHEVEAFRLFEDLVGHVWTTGVGLKETIALVGKFSVVSNDVIEAFVVITNALVTDQIEYRRSTAVADILTEAVDGLGKLSQGDRTPPSQFVEKVSSLLDIWPGQ